MNRRGLVMAKKRFTKSALWNDQTTDHPQQKRTSFPFKRSGRTDVWPLPAERLQQADFAGGGIRNLSKLLRDESHREAVAFFSEDSFVFKLF